jgi:hypothetical protein
MAALIEMEHFADPDQSFTGLGKKFGERFDKRGQIVLDAIPDHRGPEAPVSMDREIAHVDHLAPGDARMATDDFRRDMVGGLADDGEIVNHGIHDFLVVFERVEIDVGNVAPDFGDRIENVLDPEGPIPRQHRRLPAGCDLSTPV